MNTNIGKLTLIAIFHNYAYNCQLRDSFKSCVSKYLESSKETSNLEDAVIKHNTEVYLYKTHLLNINFYLDKKLGNCSTLFKELYKLKLIYVNNDSISLLYKYGIRVINLNINPWGKIIRIDRFYYCICKLLGTIYRITEINLKELFYTNIIDQNNGDQNNRDENFGNQNEDEEDSIFKNDQDGYIFENYIFGKLHELKEL